MKKIYVLFLFSILSSAIFATHNNSGEITYTHLSGLIYKIRVTTYTNTDPLTTQADRCELTVHFGDGDSAIAPRVNGLSNVCNTADGEAITINIKKNIYETTHSYLSTGFYKIHMEDPNRNAGVCNFPNSVDHPFYIESIILIDPSIGTNNSPQFIAPPIFYAVVGTTYTQNVTAYDPDGETLTYELVSCKGAGGLAIIGYTYPSGLSIDSINGEINWNAPAVICKYNFAVKVKKWRNGIMVGYVIRDFQISSVSDLISCSFSGNSNWSINSFGEYAYAINAGDSIQLNLNYSTDESNISLEAFSDAFYPSNPALFLTTTSADTIYSTFKWNTNLSNVRSSPYIITFRGSFGVYKKDVTLLICVYDNSSSPCFAYTGLNESLKNEEKILLYPNPVTDKIFISKLNSEFRNTLFIYDLAGRLIKTIFLSRSSPEVEVSDLTSGFYNYEILSDKIRIARGKFVKD